MYIDTDLNMYEALNGHKNRKEVYLCADTGYLIDNNRQNRITKRRGGV